MPEHASRFIGLYDQQNENRIPDWGGDELFTRMPSRPTVDDAPAPRFQPSLVLVDTPEEPAREPAGDDETGAARPPCCAGRPRRPCTSAPSGSGCPSSSRRGDARASRPRASGRTAGISRTRVGARARVSRRERAPNGRRTTVITGRPDGAPQPLSLVPAERRRPSRTPAEWIGARPERIVAWAFVLGLAAHPHRDLDRRRLSYASSALDRTARTGARARRALRQAEYRSYTYKG